MNYERVSFLNLRNPVILFDVISSLEEGRAAGFVTLLGDFFIDFFI